LKRIATATCNRAAAATTTATAGARKRNWPMSSKKVFQNSCQPSFFFFCIILNLLVVAFAA